MAPETAATVSNTCPCIGSVANTAGKSWVRTQRDARLSGAGILLELRIRPGLFVRAKGRAAATKLMSCRTA